jgi:hypothetical protein
MNNSGPTDLLSRARVQLKPRFSPFREHRVRVVIEGNARRIDTLARIELMDVGDLRNFLPAGRGHVAQDATTTTFPASSSELGTP